MIMSMSMTCLGSGEAFRHGQHSGIPRPATTRVTCGAPVILGFLQEDPGPPFPYGPVYNLWARRSPSVAHRSDQNSLRQPSARFGFSTFRPAAREYLSGMHSQFFINTITTLPNSLDLPHHKNTDASRAHPPMASTSPPPLASPPGDDRPDKKHVTKLSTLSPEAIRVAAEITPNRLANLLIRKGPLAIRLITAQLAVEVPGFDHLLLSKQRRLIMAAMEQGDVENNVVFEKIGWGQWAVRRVDLDYIVSEGAGTTRLNIHELKEKAKLGWLKKEGDERRRSISASKPNLHNVRLPNESLDAAILDSSDSDSDDDHDVLSFRRAVGAADIDDNAITEDLDEDEAELFEFEDDLAISRFKRLPPVKFANRVPTKFSPPPPLAGTRRKSSLAGAAVSKNTSYGSTRHQVFNRLRLNSIENLDNYIVSSAKHLSFLVNSPTPVPQAGSVNLASPIGSWLGSANMLHLTPENIASALLSAGRRKLSFNELSIRLTLLSSLPRKPYENGHLLSSVSVAKRPTGLRHDAASDTDEEDWATIGAETLRNHSAGLSSPARGDSHEENAARALVDLMGT